MHACANAFLTWELTWLETRTHCVGSVTALVLIEDQRWRRPAKWIWNSWYKCWPGILKRKFNQPEFCQRKQLFQEEVKVMPLDAKLREIITCWQKEGNSGWKSQAACKITKEHSEWGGSELQRSRNGKSLRAKHASIFFRLLTWCSFKLQKFNIE